MLIDWNHRYNNLKLLHRAFLNHHDITFNHLWFQEL
jgi:hypothetical protein